MFTGGKAYWHEMVHQQSCKRRIVRIENCVQCAVIAFGYYHSRH